MIPAPVLAGVWSGLVLAGGLARGPRPRRPAPATRRAAPAAAVSRSRWRGLLLPVLLPTALVAVLLGPAAGAATGMGVLVASWWRARRAAARERRRLAEALPELAERLVMGVRAGLSVPLCLRLLADHGEPVARRPFLDAVAALELGRPLDGVLDGVASALGAEGRQLVAALRATAGRGVAIETSLTEMIEDARRRRRRGVEARIRRLPVLLLLPGALGVLPAFVLLVVVPVAATALDGLTW